MEGYIIPWSVLFVCTLFNVILQNSTQQSSFYISQARYGGFFSSCFSPVSEDQIGHYITGATHPCLFWKVKTAGHLAEG